MCGLLAALSFGPHLEAQPFVRALKQMQVRGPDGSGLWQAPQEQVLLAHVRLALRDLQGGQQPLHSPDGRLHAVVNGELYDYATLRPELESRGYAFKTHSDSELVLALYQVYGLDFVQHLRGEFALVLWDGERLIAVRDRFGIKPLCFARQADQLWLASRPQTLLNAGWQARWNQEALIQTFALQYPLPHQTLFAGIEQIPPGHLLQAWPDGRIHLQAYWDCDYPERAELKPGAPPSETVRHQLEEAVKCRLESDLPLCAHLSGGIDSTIVLQLLAQYSPEKITAFSVSFPNHGDYDEIALARNSARRAGVLLQEVPVTVSALIAATREAVGQSEGLTINGHLSAKFLLNQAIHRAGFKAALTGEGADEVLLGYSHFRQDLGLPNYNPLVEGLYLNLAPDHRLPELEAELGFVPAFLRAKAALGQRLQQLLQPAALTALDLTSRAERALLQSLPPSQLRGRHRVHQSAWIWHKLALANYILHTLGDGTEMAHSLETRLPYLDHHSFEQLRQFSPEAFFSPKLEKMPLRQAFAAELPPELSQRPKHPFTAPPLSLYPEWRQYLHDCFQELKPAPWVSQTRVLKLLQRLPDLPESEHRHWDPVLHLLLSATLLQDVYGLSSP